MDLNLVFKKYIEIVKTKFRQIDIISMWRTGSLPYIYIFCMEKIFLLKKFDHSKQLMEITIRNNMFQLNDVQKCGVFSHIINFLFEQG